jgi:hypothetical protein
MAVLQVAASGTPRGFDAICEDSQEWLSYKSKTARAQPG